MMERSLRASQLKISRCGAKVLTDGFFELPFVEISRIEGRKPFCGLVVVEKFRHIKI